VKPNLINAVALDQANNAPLEQGISLRIVRLL